MKKTLLALCLASIISTPTIAANFKKQENPLHYAASIGEINYIQKLIEEDPSLISQYNDNGLTPIHITIEKNNIKSLNKILDLKANPNIKDAFGTPALIYAIKKNNLSATKALIKNGAKKEVEDASGKNAYFYAKKAKKNIRDYFFPPKKQTQKVTKKKDEKELLELKNYIEEINKNTNEKFEKLFKQIEERDKTIKELKSEINLNKTNTNKVKDDLSLTDMNILEIEKNIDKNENETKGYSNEINLLKQEQKELIKKITSIQYEIKDIKEKQIINMYTNNKYLNTKEESQPIAILDEKGTIIKPKDEKAINIPTNGLEEVQTYKEPEDKIILDFK